MKSLKYPVLFIIITSAIACTKDITIKPVSYTSKLSIQSLITPGESPTVYLYHTVPYFDVKQSARQLFIRNAVVVMSSPAGSISFTVDSSYNIVRCDYDYYYK